MSIRPFEPSVLSRAGRAYLDLQAHCRRLQTQLDAYRSGQRIAAKPLEKLRLVVLENPAVEGMFAADGTLLDFWPSQDATWRREYFRGLMASLGYEVTASKDRTLMALLKKAAHR